MLKDPVLQSRLEEAFKFKKHTYIRKIKPNRVNFFALILGDVHLGLSICRIGALVEFLLETKFQRLILQGDTFNDKSLVDLPELHTLFLELLRQLEAEGIDLIWIRGNHDPNLFELLERFYRPGCGVYDEYQFTVQRRKFLVLHGDRFDTFIETYVKTTTWATWFYELVAHYEGDGGWSLAAFLKHLAKDRLLHVVRVIRQEAMAYAATEGCDVVITGHTHQLEHAKSGTSGEKNWLHYFNAGDFTQRRSGAVGVTPDGNTYMLRVTTWRKPRKRK